MVDPPLIPFLYPERLLRSRRATTRPCAVRDSRTPEDQLPAIVARVEHEGLRSVARSLGVSHETLRAVLRAAGFEGLSWLPSPSGPNS